MLLPAVMAAENAQPVPCVLCPATRCAGSSTISSRLGLKAAAVEVENGTDLLNHVVQMMSAGGKVDYVVADEAQFYTEDHIEQLARMVDELSIDRPWVHATEGTAQYQEPFLLRAVAKALANDRVHVIMTTGDSR